MISFGQGAVALARPSYESFPCTLQGFRMDFGIYEWSLRDPVVKMREGSRALAEHFKAGAGGRF